MGSRWRRVGHPRGRQRFRFDGAAKANGGWVPWRLGSWRARSCRSLVRELMAPGARTPDWASDASMFVKWPSLALRVRVGGRGCGRGSAWGSGLLRVESCLRGGVVRCRRSGWVEACTGDQDQVERAVEFAVAWAVEAVADCLAWGGGDRGGAGEACEGGFRSDAAWVWPGEDELGGGVRSDAGLVEQLRCELAGQCFDLACQRPFLRGQLQHASSDRAQREHVATQLWIASRLGSSGCQAPQQPSLSQRPQLAAQRLRGCNQQISELAQSSALRVDGSFPCSDECLQRLPFTANPRRRRPLLSKHAARGANSVKRVALAARATLPPQPAHLEHPLTTAAQETRQTRTERAASFNRKRAPTQSVRLDELQHTRVALTTCGNGRLEDNRPTEHVHDR